VIDKKTYRAPRNRTLVLDKNETERLRSKLLYVSNSDKLSQDIVIDKIICADLFDIINNLPKQFADLIVLDPPYNLNKDFHGLRFNQLSDENYYKYLQKWFDKILKTLKPNGSIYLCGDWKNSHILYQVARQFLTVRNRVTWQREKGRGAKANWKNACEDIWFATLGEDYYFDIDAVKQKRKVIAPYRVNGAPKDWQESAEGAFRLTYPSNFWDDITVPYWSMSENTDHPTQKPEKLIAKLILASCPKNGVVFDPFLGSGTSAVVAKKLGRSFVGIELNETYCLWAQKRLLNSNIDTSIQGYSDGVFWERNSLTFQKSAKVKPAVKQNDLFALKVDI
jgi:site-specific DNA-methyltransferase (adenine-specific)